MIIRLKWADQYELMKKCNMTGMFNEWTSKLEAMFAKEFPNETIKVKWTD